MALTPFPDNLSGSVEWIYQIIQIDIQCQSEGDLTVQIVLLPDGTRSSLVRSCQRSTREKLL
jgi:hypothetical protein